MIRISWHPWQYATCLRWPVRRRGPIGLLRGALAVALVAPLPALLTSAAPAVAATVSATLVRTTAVSSLTPPVPDPSGIVYLPGRDRLLISDAEVDEMTIYQGANLFETTRTGALRDTGTTLPATKEPAGVGHNPANGHLFISDDDQMRVYEVVAGADGRYGTSDDTRTFFSTSAFGSTDPEDVTFYPPTGELFVMEGADNDVHRVAPGPNGVFDGIPPTGDDIHTEFDVKPYGVLDPEGISYYPGRDTLLMVDNSDRVYEVNRDLMLINTIDISASNQVKAAGITVAPATDDPTRTDLYIVDRGVDNDVNPNENDGKMYEMSVALPPIPNLAPLVDVGPDKATHVGEPLALSATVRDDGRPAPVSLSWSRVSGPGNVSFTSPQTAETSATFDATGTYVLRLTADDSVLSGSDDITVTVVAPGAPLPLNLPVPKAFDDVEENISTGKIDWLGSTLNLPRAGTTAQAVGIRFANVDVPRGATIAEAWIQFTTSRVSTNSSTMQIAGIAADNTPTFHTTLRSVTSRTRTQATVSWTPPGWSTVGQAGAGQRTADLRSVVQEVVGRTGWARGNAVGFVITGTGERDAYSHDGGPAPVLHLAYTAPTGGNTPPTAAFTSSCTGLSCSFDGTGSSDPQGPIASYQWNFGDGTTGSGAQPTHTYSAGGTYTVALTVTDGDGATGTVSHAVNVTSAASPIAFRGVARFVGNTTSATLTVPSTVQTGDGLILFATLNVTATTVTGPSGVTGWTQFANFITGSARTIGWKKSAAAGDGGRVLTLTLSGYTKINLQLAAYGGTSTADPVASFATRSDPADTTSHPTPTVPVSSSGSWLLSYWADKSSTTTDWVPPVGSVPRDEAIGTGSGRITSLLADSGGVIPTGTAGGLVATTDAASRAATLSIVLAPTP
jgi:PKD repeat protein